MMTVLLIDDNTELLHFIERSLKGDLPHVDVLMASTCREAYSFISDREINLIVVDIKLPDGSGLDVVRSLLEFRAKPKVILTSGDPYELEKFETLSIDVDTVLLKPFDAKKLIEICHDLSEELSASATSLYSPKSRNQIRRNYLFDINPEYPKPTKSIEISRHYALNRLSGLLAGIYSFGADVRAEAPDDSVSQIVEDYVPKLTQIVKEVSALVNKLGAVEETPKG